MIKSKIYLLYTTTVVLLLVLTYLAAFRLSFGSYTPSEWWIREIYLYKEYVASNIKQPKIIISSGSNGLFGINSGVLEEVTGYPVANMAVHGALDIDFLYYKLLDHVNEGDIVVMPLEFGMYVRTYDSEWFSNNMISWGYEDFFRRLPLEDKLRFILQTAKPRIFLGIISKSTLARSDEYRMIPALSQAQVVTELEPILNSTAAGRWQGYSYKSLNKYGDINVEQVPTQRLLTEYEKGIRYVNLSPGEHFFTVFQKITQLIEARKAKLILTWPVSIRNKAFDLSAERAQKKTNKLKALLAKRGIDIHCNPALFNLDVRFFFNSVNHPNKHGALIRSQTLGTCINSLLKDENYQEKGFAESVEIVKRLEAEYDP